jgi:hypothetical protein
MTAQLRRTHSLRNAPGCPADWKYTRQCMRIRKHQGNRYTCSNLKANVMKALYVRALDHIRTDVVVLTDVVRQRAIASFAEITMGSYKTL